MKRSVQILILLALIPTTGIAREETLEERKKRITRKYMRERTQLMQSDMYVPETLEEDDQLTDSEGFKDLKPVFEKEEAGVRPPPPPPPQQMIPYEANQNWLLTDPALDEDPFSNLFDPYQSESQTDHQSDYWAMYGGRPSATEKKVSVSEREQAYREQLKQSFGLDNNRDQDRFGSQTTRPRTGIFGQENRQTSGQEDTRIYSSGFGTPARSYGASPETGLLNTPFSRSGNSDEVNPRERQQQLTPRKSYTPLNRTQQTQSGLQPKQQYTKPDSFQQWKDRNKAWDPTSDDAYLDELMQRDRR